jgi:hypothetical protein
MGVLKLHYIKKPNHHQRPKDLIKGIPARHILLSFFTSATNSTTSSSDACSQPIQARSKCQTRRCRSRDAAHLIVRNIRKKPQHKKPQLKHQVYAQIFTTLFASTSKSRVVFLLFSLAFFMLVILRIIISIVVFISGLSLAVRMPVAPWT